MNRIFRGMAGLIVAFGASACASDPTLDFGGESNMVQVTPQVLFIDQGEQEVVLVRLVNDRNQSVPAKFEVSNVGAGITVTFDSTYRPDYVNDEGTLQPNELQSQHRYFVTANEPKLATFTVSNGSASTEVTVRVVPNSVSAFSNAAPAIGEEVTINAIGDVSFNVDSTTVNFANGGDALITAISAKSITFIPIPGSNGKAEIDHVTADYLPTLGEYTLETPDEIDVPAVTSIPLSYSSTNLGALETVTVSATGFVFEENVEVTYNTNPAFIISNSGTSLVLLAPTGLAGATAVVSNVHLASLPSISLADLPSPASISTGSGYAQLPGTGTAAYNGGGQPAFNVGPVGTATYFGDSPSFGDASWDGAAHPSSWYQIDVTGAGDREFTMGWNTGADVDLWVVDPPGNTAFVQQLTGANPEQGTGTLADGTTYFVIAELWSGTPPTELLVTIK